MIRVFNGKWRGLGKNGEHLGMLLGFHFRNILHNFKGAKLAVFLAIALHANEDGVAFPSYDTLEKESGYSRAAIAKALNELCKMEIDGHAILARLRVRDEQGRFAGSNYYLIFPTPEDIQSLEIKLSSPEFRKSNSGKSKPEVKPIVKDKPIEEEEAPPEIFSYFESNIGPLTPISAETLGGWVDDYSEGWVRDAIKIANNNQARSLNYIDAILKRWHKEGKDNGFKKGKRGKSPQSRSLQNLQELMEEYQHG